MSELQRNFSFQTHDDDPAYHPIDRENNSPSRSPMMPEDPARLGGNTSYGAGDGQSSNADPSAPARDWEAYRRSLPPDNAPTRVPEDSEMGLRSAGGAQWREPGQREGDSEYYSPPPPPTHARTSITRKPVSVGTGAGGEPAPAAAGARGEVAGEGEGGPVNNGGENGVEINDSALLSPRPGENDPRLTPVGGYREDERYWGPELGYPQGTRHPGYHSGGGEYYANRRSQGSSPSPIFPPTLSSPSSQVPLVDRSPLPPAHGLGTLEDRSGDRVLSTPVGGHYTDNPYNRYSTTWDPVLSSTQVQVDGTPDTYVQSDDEDETYRRGQATGAAGAAAASGGALAALGARVGRPAPSHSYNGGGAGGGFERGGLLGGSDVSSGHINNEKVAQSEWLQSQNKSRKKTRWIVGILIIFVLLCVAGGTSAGIILTRKGSKDSSGGSSAGSGNGGGSGGGGGGGGGLSESDDIRQNGDLNADSAEIRGLMSNTKLKKVFHGMDYTPLNAVFPECIKNPPTQNNITRDIAVMSRLTDKLRLYGTDCNQTEMVLHAIDVLKVDMKIWLGVWLDGNTTTNARQLGHLYKLLDQYSPDRFEGVAVGNEVLFRKELSSTQLFSIIDDVRHNLTSLKINLPVGTSDLGSNWKAEMVSSVDVLMANVHPFFAGVKVNDAANWTYNFFQENDVSLTTGLTKKPRVMISEVGWPSDGGSYLGSVAGIDEMNTFMKDFVCKENSRGTEYFWFSAFDEPWKVKYNEPLLNKEWEDKWGLMDVNRNLKDGLEIPDCK